MVQEGHPDFLLLPLVQQALLGIRGAGVGLVAPALPAEVHRRVVRILVRRRSLLGPEALEAGRGLDQGSVHAEVLVRQHPFPLGRPHHLVEQGPTRVVCQQPLPVLGEDRVIEAAFHQVHVQEPAV